MQTIVQVVINALLFNHTQLNTPLTIILTFISSERDKALKQINTYILVAKIQD